MSEIEQLKAERDAARKACAELAAKIAEHDDACELVQEYVDATAAAMDETCGKDEKHCPCVPLLRHESKRLRAEASTYAKAVHRLQKAFDDQCNASRKDSAEIEGLKKACAEMRHLLERYGAMGPSQNEIVHALSTDCGKGYVHKRELEPLRKALLEVRPNLFWSGKQIVDQALAHAERVMGKETK